MNTNGVALVAAADLGNDIGAIMSCGGWSNLVGITVLEQVKSPTLLIVGENDESARRMNQEAYQWLRCEKELKIVAGITDPIKEERGLEESARLSANWFHQHLRPKQFEAMTG
ncbi:MAG: hypothetical protein AB1489_28240 [Acidobacteriota bacterium]